MLAIGILWCLFTLYAVAMFLPPLNRLLREWEIKRKPVLGTVPAPNLPQRVVLLLLTLLMATVAFASAFHRDLRATIGINSGTACWLMIILPALYFLLGCLKKSRKGGQQPGA